VGVIHKKNKEKTVRKIVYEISAMNLLKELFTLFNFLIVLVILVLFSVVHLMYGDSQTSKYHFIIQEYYMSDFLPTWMQNKPKDTKYGDVNYTGKYTTWHRNGIKQQENEYINGKFIKGTCWSSNGNKFFVFEMKEGKKNGKIIQWDKNGKKIREQDWLDGVMVKEILGPSK